MAGFFSHLECALPCGAGPYDPRHPHQICTCGAPLLARYDLTSAGRWTKASLAGREASMWRYREVLPLIESGGDGDLPVTLGEGWTPLLRARRLGKAIGLTRLYVKDESANPTQAAAARGMATAVTRAQRLGCRALSVATTAYDAAALAAYAARAGLAAHVFLAAAARSPFARHAALFGADVALVGGEFDEARQLAAEQGQPHGWYGVTAFGEPYRIEGLKTIAYELCEQLDWQLPDWIVCPTGSGALTAALWKAFAEMAALGWIDPVRRPHLAAVQAAGCAPIVRAFGAGADHAAIWQTPHTVAAGLRVPGTTGDVLVLRALRESAGAALAVGDAEMTAGATDAARLEGIGAALESGAAFHALRVLIAEGRIHEHDTVAVINVAGPVGLD